MLFKFGGIFRKVWRVALILGTFVIGTSTLLVAPVSAATGINQQLNFQGRLLNAQGAVVTDGYYNVEFKIYQDGTGTAAGNPGGTLKWTEDWLNSAGNGVRVMNGYISVQLGSLNPFGNSVDWNQDTIWLSVNIGNTNVSCTPFASCSGDGEMLPMKRLSAVPYALNSARLGGLTAAGFIQNTTTVQTATNMAIDGTARADTSVLTPYIDTNTATALNIGDTNATSINLNQNVTVAANKTLTLAGGSTVNRPASPTEGMLWYDTDTKQLLIYANDKWQADRSTSTKIVAASNASQALKDGADYVATGTGDQATINTALTAAAGGKVYLTEGTFTINGSISIPNNTTLAGAGAGTIITIPNSFNTDINAITNTTTGGNGTGITIQDLRLEGNRTNQTSGIMYGIYFNGVGSGSGVSGIQGAKITGIRAENWYVGVGISLNSSANNTISNNTIRNNGLYGISIAGSSNNKIIGNDVQASATRSIHLSNSSSNIVSNNTVATGSGMGISIASSSNNNVISDNRLYDNGSSSLNNSIYLDASDSNTITGNNITDTSATTTNYAINISNSTSDTNYLADNTLGGGSINDLGTGTIYAGQYSSTTNFLIQPASNITIGSASTITNLQGAVGVNTSNPQSQFEVKGGSGISSGTVTMTATSGSATFTTSGSITLNRGDWIVPTTSTSQAMYVATTATGTSFTAHTLFGANITAETFTVYKSTANFTDSSGTSLLRVAGNGNVSIGDSLAGGPGSALKLTVGGSALINGNLWTQSISNTSSTSNAFIQLNATGSVLSRNVADANAALTVSQLNAGSTGNILTLQNSSGMVASFSQAGNLNIASILDTTTATALNIGTSNATSINLNQNVTVASGKSLTLVGGTTASRPASPTEGMVYFDTTTKQLLVYSNGKWQSDRSTSTKIVAASNASQALKDSADYVATGTGDQSTINTALTAAAGGKVYLTEGTYTINGSISVPNNTTLAGAGRGTIITIPNGANLGYGAITNTTTGGNGTGITIQDLRLEGNKANQTLGQGGIYFRGLGFGSDSSAVQGAKISGVWANNWYGDGISFYDSFNSTITGTSAEGNNGRGINLEGFYYYDTNNTVSNNVVQGNTSDGIYVGYTNANTVTGNVVQSNGGVGIYLSAAKRTTVTGNVVQANRYGIAVSSLSSDNTVSGNDMYDNGGTTTNNGIYVNSSDYNIITGNTIADTSGTTSNYAININSATADNNYLADNLFRSTPGTATIRDLGTGTVYANQPRSENGGQLTNRTANDVAAFTIQNAAGTNALAVDTTTNSVLVAGALDTTTATTLSLGTTNATSITVGKAAVGTWMASSTVTVGTSGSSTSIMGAAQTTANTDGNSMTISGSAGLGTGKGGNVIIQGGTAGATSGANGGNLTLSGGTGSGTGVNGLVIINNATYSTSATQASASSVNVTQANIDSFGAIILNATGSSVNFTLTAPTLGTNAAGRVIYVTAANGSQDFTLRANVGGGTGVEQNIAMRQNTTATMIWNGSQWTAAGASSSTTLQAAYDNTLQSAGGAELVVSKTGTTNGLTIRDSSSAPVNGTLLSIQTKTASTLLSVNSNVTDYATNGGAETAFATDWALIPSSGATVSRNTTAANIAVGTGSVTVTTATSANSGARNTLSAALTPGLRYNVSFTAKLSSGNFVDMNVNYSNDGTTATANTPCTNYSTQAIATSVWTKINCTFTAPAGTTATNAIFIRQTASGTARTFYVDNLSVTIGADQSYATDGDVNDATNFASNWQIVTGGGTASATRDTDYGYRASDSAKATISTATAGAGIKNKLSINPLATTPGTLYRITAYASSTTAMTDFTIRYSRDNGTNFDACVDYNTQTLSGSASDFKKITCYVTVSSTAASNAWVFFTQGAGAARSIYVDSFSMTIASNTTPNVQVGGGVNGGPTTLFTLDKGASAPIANDNDALLGSMYYDTTLGKLQCYEADGWGACGSSPDTVVTISPEYNNAVLHGTGVGTMTSDICSDTLNINDATNGPVICGTNETYNFYKWTSPQASPQTYSIYVTYQLPSTFKEFASGQTSLMGRTNSANAAVSYRIFRSDSSGLTPCSAAVSVSTGVQTSWQTKIASGAADPSTCGFEPGDSVVFQIDMVASTTANAYVSNLNFVFSNR